MVASAMVTAGLRCAPLMRPTAYTATATAIAQPAVITIQPELCPFVRSRTTLATTPSPSSTRIIVPMASASIDCMKPEYSRCTMRRIWTFVLLALSAALAAAQPAKPRARDLGVPFEGTPGALNAITDVAGVEVGLVTLISGDGPLVVGTGPVRTGVTAIHPRGKRSNDP